MHRHIQLYTGSLPISHFVLQPEDAVLAHHPGIDNTRVVGRSDVLHIDLDTATYRTDRAQHSCVPLCEINYAISANLLTIK